MLSFVHDGVRRADQVYYRSPVQFRSSRIAVNPERYDSKLLGESTSHTALAEHKRGDRE